MSVIDRSSTAITNRDATPLVLSNPSYAGSKLDRAYGYVSATAADSASSAYRMIQVPSNARIASLSIACAALGGSSAVDVGVYYGNDVQGANQSAIINQSFFASAIALSSALGKTDIINESGTNTLDIQEQPLWQALGLSADPKCHFDIVATVSTAINTTGLVSLECSYQM